MKILFLSFGLLVMVFSNAHADSLYRWVDKEGKVHYGDRPAEDAIMPEQKKFGAPPDAGDDDLSYNVRKAKQDFPVTLYTTADCGEQCVLASSFLNKRGIPFIEKKLSTKAEFDAFKKQTGGTGVPALTVGKSLLSGFEAGQWNSELDLAGYPKTAAYGSRPVKPAVVKPEAATETEK